MSQTDPRIDAYIAKSAEFARPILRHLRELVHQGCPEVEETIKWSMPAFVCNGLLCMMAAFKQHATFNFWNGNNVVGGAQKTEAMGQFGRITSLSDLPPDRVMLGYIRRAASLKKGGVEPPSRERSTPGPRRELAVPDFFIKALKNNRKAHANFEGFSYSHKKEYIEWLTDAKREETRQKRLKTALAWIATGKPQNWKYLR